MTEACFVLLSSILITVAVILLIINNLAHSARWFRGASVDAL